MGVALLSPAGEVPRIEKWDLSREEAVVVVDFVLFLRKDVKPSEER
jgi:hypothetical protein